jgi:hypothetical protein
MASTTQAGRTRSPAEKAQVAQRAVRGFTIAAIVVGVFAVGGIVTGIALSGGEEAVFDDSLPNPMGGPARTAPGEASGTASFAGLQIDDVEIAMGDIALGVTYVPAWEVTNPTDRAVVFTAGQPQVVEGCCPGPVYADGELIQVDEALTVPAGGSVLLQFPLQMHAGMDGPHHLTIPLTAEGEMTEVHVIGNFTATASPI